MMRNAIRALAVCAGAACGLAAAQEKAPDGLKTGANLGFSLTDGNSETLTVNAALTAEGERPDLGSVRAGIEANYGEAGTGGAKETTVQNARLFANARKTLGERTFASLDFSAAHDDVAAVDYRVAVGPGLGLYAVRNDRVELSFEAGPSYVWEKTGGAKDDYLAVRIGERLAWKLGPTARLWQSVEALPRAEDPGQFLLKAEIGIEAAINSRLSLRVVLQNTHDSEPAAGLEKNDLSLVAGLGIRLH